MEYTVAVDTTGLKSDITLMKSQLDTYIKKCLVASCKLIKSEAKKNHFFKSRTGTLERAIKYKVISQLQTGIIRIDKKEAPYGIYVHEGTGIYGPKGARYSIEPRNAKWLAFFWERQGSFVFSKKVMHPGSDDDQFLYNALEDNIKNIDDIFKEGLHELIRGESK